MADFNLAFEKMIADEGGYVLHTIPGDTGGMTYAGIARNKNPNWPGWNLIDHEALNNPSAFGIRGLKERAKVVGGWLDISTRPGSGTTVILTIPLDGGASSPNEADFL